VNTVVLGNNFGLSKDIVQESQEIVLQLRICEWATVFGHLHRLMANISD
jgi:hypothetical protein